MGVKVAPESLRRYLRSLPFKFVVACPFRSGGAVQGRTPSGRRTGAWWLLVGLSFALSTSSCLSPEQALAEVDAEADSIVRDAQVREFAETRPFDVRTPQGRIRDETVAPETGLATRPTPLHIGLAEALDLAATNSREFQTEKERLYQSALSLMRERERFRPNPFFDLSGTAASSDANPTLGAQGEIGVTKVLERGGQVVLSAGGDFLRFITSPTAQNAASFLNLVVTLPFLRGAGEDVAMENLRQADRDVIYALRDLERFKQTFSVDVEARYYRLLASGRRVKNEERNLASITEARRRNEAFAEAQRLTEIEVDQARQDELRARNRVVTQNNSFGGQLDEFKILLGIPVDLPVTLGEEELDRLVKELDRPFVAHERDAMRNAVRLRLDLQNVHDQIADARRRILVAENALLPSLDLSVSARPDSENLKPFKVRFENGRYSGSVSTDLGFDRDVESISLRQAHLDLEEAVRAEESIADRVKSQIRDAMRTVSQATESYRIQERAVAVAKRRVESVNEFKLRGDATTRDLLEAQESLVNAENDLVEALVDYRVAYLNFYRDTGALVVNPRGLDHETSDALLQAP